MDNSKSSGKLRPHRGQGDPLAFASRCDVLTACQCIKCRPQTDEERRTGYRATWRHEDQPFLCINRRPEHIQNPQHVENVVAFLIAKGLTDPMSRVGQFGIQAADAVAAEIDMQELAGQDWAQGLRNRGGYIHAMIRRKSEGARSHVYRDRLSVAK